MTTSRVASAGTLGVGVALVEHAPLRVIGAVAVAALAGCGVRAPKPIDVAHLLATRGPIEAHRDLEIRILADPRDIQARLAVAALDDQLGRPAEAIDELDEVEKQGGVLGVRWRDADRARLARLLVARGRARLARGSAAALDDFERALGVGARIESSAAPAAIAPVELVGARAAAALAKLRHVDAGLRAEGRRELAAIATQSGADPSWRGAAPAGSAIERAAFAEWLWAHGARREAYEQLVAWHAAAGPQSSAGARAAYLRALAWWSPIWSGESPAPSDAELVGPERCRFGCRARDALGDDEAERALLGSPLGARVTDPADAAAWAAIALRGALRGSGSWSQQLAARVDLGTLDLHALPRLVRPTFARLKGVTGKREPAPTAAELDAATADERFVAAAERVVIGSSPAAVRAALGESLDRADGRALLAIVEPIVPVAIAEARARAVARYVAGRTGAATTDDEAAFVELARAFDRDPAIAERLGRDYVARAVDASLAHAAVGAAFEALGDARVARAEWQAAVDGDPAFAAGLAEAIARAGDGDAALVAVAAGAAGSGDPAPVLVLVAHALLDAKRPIEALAAARSAIDLAGPEALAPALDVAIAASHVAKRDAQADSLLARRAKLAPPLALAVLPFDDPTDAGAALDALGHSPTAAAEAARAWVAAAWNPRDVGLRVALLGALPPGDPRKPTIVAELVELAGAPDGDFEAALRAARAVRAQR
ncbi:MAG TPA: hypothetical protein VH143_26285 [Kofleriaceae bacterium]|nr:hypothetical protein [Kofleriaceae bacterium]